MHPVEEAMLIDFSLIDSNRSPTKVASEILEELVSFIPYKPSTTLLNEIERRFDELEKKYIPSPINIRFIQHQKRMLIIDMYFDRALTPENEREMFEKMFESYCKVIEDFCLYTSILTEEE